MFDHLLQLIEDFLQGEVRELEDLPEWHSLNTQDKCCAIIHYLVIAEPIKFSELRLKISRHFLLMVYGDLHQPIKRVRVFSYEGGRHLVDIDIGTTAQIS